MCDFNNKSPLGPNAGSKVKAGAQGVAHVTDVGVAKVVAGGTAEL